MRRALLLDNGPVTAEVVSKKKKRGRESAGDMVRSLGLVLVGVAVVWFFAQPPDSDEQAVRIVDPSRDFEAFTLDAGAAPVPQALPAQWRPTSSTRTGAPPALRVGYVTPAGQYAEYAASTEPAAIFVPLLTGETERLEAVEVGELTWEQYRDADGSLSLVREYGPVTVALGSTRGTASLEELRVLAAALTTA